MSPLLLATRRCALTALAGAAAIAGGSAADEGGWTLGFASSAAEISASSSSTAIRPLNASRRLGEGGAMQILSATSAGVGFQLLGSGPCRTTSWGAGTFTELKRHGSVLTAHDCERHCAEESKCKGFELTYDLDNVDFRPDLITVCELHTEAVTQVADVVKDGVIDLECWSKGGRGRQHHYVLVGTGHCLTETAEHVSLDRRLLHPTECRGACNAEPECLAYEVADGVDGKPECNLFYKPRTQVGPCHGSSCQCWARKPGADERGLKESWAHPGPGAALVKESSSAAVALPRPLVEAEYGRSLFQ